jgi:hypothetical protein
MDWKEDSRISIFGLPFTARHNGPMLALNSQRAKRTLGPRMMTKATVMMQTTAIKGQPLSIGIGSPDGPKGIIVPRVSQFVSHSSPDVPPKVEAAAEIRIKIIPLGFSAPARHIKIPPAK